MASARSAKRICSTATSAPVLLAPAMHTGMWQNAATVDNVATLRRHGSCWAIAAAHSGTVMRRSTNSAISSGSGRRPGPESRPVRRPVAVAQQDLAGKRVVISLGGTREAIDPVRYLGNSSSGRFGAINAGNLHVRRHSDVNVGSDNVDIGPASSGDLSDSPAHSTPKTLLRPWTT
jgi:phosphopantothenoylcysteine decarboxylase/phosphopantothenate--cysteine ligase